MRLPQFQYHSPKTLSEACVLLSTLKDAKVLAGGTDLLVGLREEKTRAAHLVSIKNLALLKGIQDNPREGLRLGALVTLNELCFSKTLKERYPGIHDAACSMCAFQTRNQATLGGNLVSAVPSADMPPILLAMGAKVTLARGDSRREIPLDKFFTGPKQSILTKDEILIEILVPPQSPHAGSAYLKHELRGALALAVVGVAVSLAQSQGTCTSARIALGAVAPTPILTEEAASVLIGKPLSDELFAKAGTLAGKTSRPISDVRGSEGYRREMVEVLTRRALKKAWERSR